MCRSGSVLLLLFLALSAQLGRVVCADDPNAAKEVCGHKLSLVQGTIKSWLAAFEQCPLHKLCENKDHVTQYEQIRLRCSIAWKSRPATATVPDDVLPKIETAMNNLKAMFRPLKDELAQLDKVVDQQVRDAWRELDALQTEVFHSTLASGRTERAVFYSFLAGDSSPKLDNYFQPSNVQELLKYAWALPLNALQRNVYSTIEKLVGTSKDATHQTLYTIDVANVVNPLLENQANLLNDHVQQLRANLSSNSYDALVSIARRFPERFAYLSDRLFKQTDGTLPKADTLPNVANFIGQLPTAEQRLQAAGALLQSLTVQNGTLVTDAEYVYPVAKLAYTLHNLLGADQQYPGADSVRAKFNTPVSDKSVQYYTQLLPQPSSMIAA
uniref:TRIO salivary gland protein n=1 Tax=Anopheles culicifacies TaxID=139723 RepID=A0A182LV57_9DIPT